MGELGNTTEQATPGANPPIHLPPDPHGAAPGGGAGGQQAPGGAGGAKVPDAGSGSSAVPDSPRPKPTKFPMPFFPPAPGGGTAPVPKAVQGGGIGGVDSGGGGQSPYRPESNDPFPPGRAPGDPILGLDGKPITLTDPAAGAGPGGTATDPTLPYVPGYGIPPAGTPPGPPVTHTETGPGTGGATPLPPSDPGFDPKPPPAPGEPGAADDESTERTEIG